MYKTKTNTNTTCNYALFHKQITKDTHKVIVNLDNDLCVSTEPIRLIKKVLCLFTDSDNNPVSLSKNTNVHFNVLLKLHANHTFHHYNYNLGKKKYFFTEKKQEEEGLKKNPFIWILDFGWTLHEDNMHDHSNFMEFSFHLTEHFDKQIQMQMLVFYEDEDYNEFEFGWLASHLAATHQEPWSSLLVGVSG